LFGTLAVIAGLLFVLSLPLSLLTEAKIVAGLILGGFYGVLFFGALWFACWALGKLWKIEG